MHTTIFRTTTRSTTPHHFARHFGSGTNRNVAYVLLPETPCPCENAHTQKTCSPAATADRPVTNGAAGFLLDLIASIGLLTLPLLAPAIASEQVTAILGGIALGATVGSVAQRSAAWASRRLTHTFR